MGLSLVVSRRFPCTRRLKRRSAKVIILKEDECNENNSYTQEGSSVESSQEEVEKQTEMNNRFCQLILGIVIWLSFGTNLYAQAQDIRFERISLEDGLSQVTINCILQDQDGFMWFGTADGLNRYDGYSFKVFRHDPREDEFPA